MVQKIFKDPSFRLQSISEYLKGTVFFLILFSLLLVINLAQTASLVLLPFSRRAFRSFNRFCANTWWGACILTARWMNGVRLTVTGDEIPSLEDAIVFANHQQMSDIFILMLFAITKGRLGDLKWLVKDILKYVPGIGWGMLFLDCLFVKRNWEADREKIQSLFQKFKNDQIPVWMISFVEGTRITPVKLERSQKYAREKGLPHLQNVMLPRTKGFVATVQGLSGHVSVVYDVTIGYPEGTASLWQIAKGTATRFNIHVRRFELSHLPSPEDPAALSKWLVERFHQKDRLLGSFNQQGEFALDNSVSHDSYERGLNPT